MEKLKKYLPYILGGGVVLYLLYRSQSGSGQAIGRATPAQTSPDLRGAAFQSLAEQAARESDAAARLEAERIRAANALALEQLRANTVLEQARLKQATDLYNIQAQENARAAASKQSAINAAINAAGKAIGGLGGGAGNSAPQARTPPISPTRAKNIVRLPIVGDIDLTGILGPASLPSQSEYPSIQLGNVYDLPGTSFDSGPSFYDQYYNSPEINFPFASPVEVTGVGLSYEGGGYEYGSGLFDYGLPSYSDYYTPNTLGDYGYGQSFDSGPIGGGADFGYSDYGYSAGGGGGFGSTGNGYSDFGYQTGYDYNSGASYDFYGGVSGGGYVDSNIPTYSETIYGGSFDYGGYGGGSGDPSGYSSYVDYGGYGEYA